MANVTIDPLGGIYTRKGWECWNDEELMVDPATWDPRRAYMTQLHDGTDLAYIAANGKLWMSTSGTAFTDSGAVCQARSHMADFATFGDETYVACGWNQPTRRRRGALALDPATALGSLSPGNSNDDYLNPVHGVFPRAELVEAHAGYAFVAYTGEVGVDYPNRIRWSHPTSQDDWAADDFLDIEIGGSHISGLMSYEDHLLIFKPDSVWALYGYNADSWQLIQKTSTIGARGPQGITRNEGAVIFYSPSDRGAIYAYSGEEPREISVPIQRALESIIDPDLVWVGWAARRLWVTLPWNYAGPTDDSAGAFVFDPAVGEGAWTFFTSGAGSLGPLMAGSNIDSNTRPMGVLRDTEHPCVVRFDALDVAVDRVAGVSVIGAAGADPWNVPILLTNTGNALIALGMPGDIPFRTFYRTPWLTAGWPTRKKSWRRPDFICRRTERDHRLQVQSFRDYEEVSPRRSSLVEIFTAGAGTRWGEFDWNDGARWGTGAVAGASIRRGSSFGMCRSLQLRLASMTPGARWGIDAIVMKYVMRRLR